MTDLQSSYKSRGSSHNFEGIQNATRQQQILDLQQHAVLQSAKSSQHFKLNISTTNIILKMQQAIKRRFFQLNHVLLAHQPIGMYIYHFIMLFEFIQILFFIFYKVEVINEFAKGDTQVFRIDYYFTFMNVQMYLLQSHDSHSFIVTYIIITTLFLFYIVIMLGLSSRLFKQERLEDLKEGMKYLVKFLGILMTCFIFLFQIPMITIYLQSYLCDEDPSNAFTLSGIQCYSLSHQLLIAFSTITLLLYLLFLFIQSLLYTSNNFESSLPWSSLERRLSIVRIIIKIILAACFVFDKQGKIRGSVDFVCFLLSLFVVYHRYFKALIFNQSVFYAMIMYEVQQMWLFLCVSLHILSSSYLTIVSLLLMKICGLFLGFIMIMLQRRKIELLIEADPTRFNSPNENEIYLFKIYKMIQSNEKNNYLLLYGILCNHMVECKDPHCKCVNIMEIQENIKNRNFNQNYQDGQGISPYKTSHNSNSHPRVNRTLSGLTSIQGTLNNTIPSHSIRNTRRMTFNTLGFQLKTRRNFKTFMNNNTVSISDPQIKSSDKEFLSERKRKKQELSWFKFLTILIEQAIEKFPKNVELKVINSFVQNRKIKNEFKAIFELMNCEQCDPSFQDQFIIFRRKIQIEQQLKKSHSKNVLDIGKIDAVQVYKYERYFQQYIILEYKTGFAALNFWRELLQKNINPDIMLQKSAEISQNYEKIQMIASKMQKIYPTEIKFFYRYACFLQQIVNNGYDALLLFEKVYFTYHGRLSKRAIPFNEINIFGENSGAAIVIISATSKKIGQIIHVSDEVENILGFNRKDLLNKNISSIMPKPLGKVHDKFIERYFETAKPTVIDIKRQLFAVTNENYLKPIRLLVKVFPHITDRLVFVGFIQQLEKFEDMDAPKLEYENQEFQYMLTDRDGNITNVTEGLNKMLGMNQKFFQYSDSIFEMMFNIQKISPDILAPDIQELLEDEGSKYIIDTTNMIHHVELERLTSDEIFFIRSKLGKYQAYIQLKTMVLDKNFCVVKLYRLYMLSKYNEAQDKFISLRASKEDEIETNENNNNSLFGDSSNIEQDDPINQASLLSSLSSTTSGGFAFNKIIKDFKKVIGERKTPKALIILNRLMISMLLSIILLASVDYGLKIREIYTNEDDNLMSLMIQSRYIEYISVVSDFRSLTNIANNLEIKYYEQGDSKLKGIDRQNYLLENLKINTENLQQTHEYITQLRYQQNNDEYMGTKLKDKEYENINLYRIQNNGNISSYQLQFRVAFNLYLAYIQDELDSNQEKLLLQSNILKAPITNSQLKNLTLTDNQKQLYFILVNGLRDLRSFSFQMINFYDKQSYQQTVQFSFTIIMAFGILITLIQQIFILYQIFVIEQNKINILSLYALLQIKDIKKVHEKCSTYLDDLQRGIFFQAQTIDDEDNSFFLSQILSFQQKQGQSIQLQKPNQVQEREQQISEEDKEAEDYRQYIYKKNGRKKSSKKDVRSFIIQNNQAEEKFKNVIQKTLEQIKAIQAQEQEFIMRAREKAHQLNNNQKHGQTGRQSKLSPNDLKKIQRKLEKKQKKRSMRQKEKKDRNQPQKAPKLIVTPNQQIIEELDSSRSYLNNQEASRRESESKPRESTESDGFDKDFVLSQVEMLEREKLFRKQIKKINWVEIIKMTVLGFLLIGYFLYVHTFHIFIDKQMKTLQDTSPAIYNRYSDLILSYNFLREKIINYQLSNQTSKDNKVQYNSYEIDSIENYFHSQSLIDQNIITDLKVSYPSTIKQVINYLNGIDNESFCSLANQYQSSIDEDQSQSIRSYKQTILDNCDQFGKGLLKKGILQALGNFNKKFTDLEILFNQTQSLNNSQATNLLNDESLKTYFAFQELYLYDMIQQLTGVWKETFKDLRNNLIAIIEGIYFVFLSLLLIMLFVVRYRMIKRMKQQIFQSRGILNLIPEDFFDQNKETVEQLIKNLKD